MFVKLTIPTNYFIEVITILTPKIAINQHKTANAIQQTSMDGISIIASVHRQFMVFFADNIPEIIYKKAFPSNCFFGFSHILVRILKFGGYETYYPTDNYGPYGHCVAGNW